MLTLCCQYYTDTDMHTISQFLLRKILFNCNLQPFSCPFILFLHLRIDVTIEAQSCQITSPKIHSSEVKKTEYKCSSNSKAFVPSIISRCLHKLPNQVQSNGLPSNCLVSISNLIFALPLLYLLPPFPLPKLLPYTMPSWAKK